MEWQPAVLEIAPNFQGHIFGLQIFADGTYEFKSRSEDGINTEPEVIHDPGKETLPIIHNKKFNQTFNPSKSHLGNTLSNNSPQEVAKLALKYYSDILQAAFEKFVAGDPNE